MFSELAVGLKLTIKLAMVSLNDISIANETLKDCIFILNYVKSLKILYKNAMERI